MTSTAPAARAARSPAPAARGLRPWWLLIFLGGALGVVTGAWQTVERIAWAADGTTASFCDVNAWLSCSSVFGHWQSSALGIPNSLIALPVFSVLAATGLAGLLGSRLSNAFVATALGLAVFMTAFIVWYMQQTAFAIGILCLFCAGCALAVLVAGAGLTRVAAAQGALGSGRFGREVGLLVRSGADLMVWGGVALVVLAMLVVGLAL